jgi:virginiamycin A acetyltransferase
MNKIPNSCNISDQSIIDISIKGSVLEMGENCYVDAFVRIKFSGGLGNIIIGDNCYINSGTVIYSGNGIRLGNCVLIAANVTIAPTNHSIGADKYILYQGFMESKGGIEIEDDVWIGANCVVLDGAVIEKGAVIAAGTVVRGRLDKNGIYAGNPIKKIGERK